jgi:hypothetical protein
MGPGAWGPLLGGHRQYYIMCLGKVHNYGGSSKCDGYLQLYTTIGNCTSLL